MRKKPNLRRHHKVRESSDLVVDVHKLSLYIRWSDCGGLCQSEFNRT